MTIILSIETATPKCSIALHADGSLLSRLALHKGQSHSTYLSPAINALIELCDLKMTDLSAIALSKGPGSYTGLRIGTSTAKGLCYALDTPLISVNTLEVLVQAVKNEPVKYFCPMLDARRMEVYSAIYHQDLRPIKPTNAVILDDHSYREILDDGRVLFFGDGSNKFRDIVKHPNAQFMADIEPDAQQLGELALQKFKDKNFEDLAYFEPYYLKEFRATKPKTLL